MPFLRITRRGNVNIFRRVWGLFCELQSMVHNRTTEIQCLINDKCLLVDPLAGIETDVLLLIWLAGCLVG